MVKERNYLIETLKSSGIKSQVYTNMKKLKAGNEVHVGAVLRNGETFARSGSKKTYIDQEGQRKRRVKLWDRSTSLHVVIADTSEEKVEEILENFLQNLKKGIDVDGNWVNIVVGEADWVEEGDSILKAKVAVPITGEAELATTGLTAKFTDAEGGDSFMEGDRFTFSSTSPAMSNESVISAVESLINSPLMFEFVHIVGVSSKALWASLCTIANDFLTKYKRPLFFVCEARGKKADESLEDYVNAMLEERKGINNIYMQVVCSNSRYQRMDGRVQDINNAGIVTGLYGRAKESQSIGEVKSFPISEAKLLKILPEGIEDYIETLDKAKYVTIRQYIGKEDYYVTSANMMSPEGSDYSYAEDVRVSNRLVKAVRAKALDELQVEVDPEDIETSITNIQEQLNTPVEDAVRDKIISSGSVTIDTENLNILVDEKLDINITYVPMGHVREMNLTFAVENPYSAS